MKMHKIERFPTGHDNYPEGCVVVTEVTDEDVKTVTEHSLSEWDALQQSQS